MLTRADLEKLPEYVPGRSVPGAIKLASNEVPYGPLPGVPEAIAEAAATSHRYPDMAVVALRERLAERLGVAPDRVATGCGSVGLTEHLATVSCHDGDEIVFSWRSFEAYPIIAATAGAAAVRVPNTAEHGHDLAAMAAAVTDRTRLVMVCNPNNPTGTFLRTSGADRVPRCRAQQRARGPRRGVPRVRHRPRRARRPGHLRRPPERGGAADDVQGMGPGRPAGRLPGRPADGGGRGSQGDHAVLHLRARPGRRARRAARPTRRCVAGRRWWWPSASGWRRRSGRGCPRCRRRRPTSSGCRCGIGRPTSPPPARRLA